MSKAWALLLGDRDEALERVLAGLSVAVEHVPSLDSPDAATVSPPDVVIAPCSPEADSAALRSVRMRWPDAELVLTFPGRDGAAGFAAARLLEADGLPLPL